MTALRINIAAVKVSENIFNMWLGFDYCIGSLKLLFPLHFSNTLLSPANSILFSQLVYEFRNLLCDYCH